MDSPGGGLSPRRWGRRSTGAPFWSKLLLAGCAAVLALLAAELALRLRDALAVRPMWRELARSEAPSRSSSELELIDLIRPVDGGRVYELRPSLAGRFQGSSYRSNSQGMRGEELPLSKPPGVFRIALLGDSHGFGWGVELKDGFARGLQDRLDAVISPTRIEVLNFCVPGYNTAMEAACLGQALRFDPDLILLQYFYNDLYLPNFLLYEPRPPLSRVWDLLARRLGDSQRGPQLLRPRLEGQADNVLAAWRRDPRRVPRRYSYMVDYQGVERALERLRVETAQAHVPLMMVVFNLPRPSAIDAGRLGRGDHQRAAEVDQPVLEMARAMGVDVIDTVAPMTTLLVREGLTTRDIIRSESDWHMNEQGHRILAEVLSAELLRSGPLEGQWSPVMLGDR